MNRRRVAGYTRAGMSSKRCQAASRPTEKIPRSRHAQGKASAPPPTRPPSKRPRFPLARPCRPRRLPQERKPRLISAALRFPHLRALPGQHHRTLHRPRNSRRPLALVRAWTMETALIDNQRDTMMETMNEKYEVTDGANRAALASSALTKDSPGLPPPPPSLRGSSHVPIRPVPEPPRHPTQRAR